MKNIIFIYLIFTAFVFGQTDSISVKINLKLIELNSKKTIAGATVINKTKSIITVSDENGLVSLPVCKGDEIYVTHISYSTYKFSILDSNLKNKLNVIDLTDKENVIDAIVVTNYKLTGYLEIDTKLLENNENHRYSIAGLNLGYEPGNKAPKAVENLLQSLKNPVDLVYQLFNNKDKDLQRLLEFKKDEAFKKQLNSQTSRETICMLLQINKTELDRVLTKCNYSKIFIETASDLQVLDAIADSYEGYRALSKK